MYYKNPLDAVRSGEFFAKNSNLAYAIYAAGKGYIVKQLTQANGLELEIIKP